MAYYEDIIITDDGRIMCELCQIYVPTDNMIGPHLDTSKHQNSYVARIIVQNNINIQGKRAFCSICEVHLSDLMDHIESVEHQRLMNSIMEIVQNDGLFIKLPKNSKDNKSQLNCLICNNIVTFTLDSLKEHVGSLKHRKARSMAVQPFNGIFSVEGCDENLWCKICQVYFENYIETIFEHVDSNKEHKKRLTKILRLIEGQNIEIDKYLANPNEHTANCLKCETVVACNVDNLERHIKGKRHNH